MYVFSFMILSCLQKPSLLQDFFIAHVFVQYFLQFQFLHSIFDLPAIYFSYRVN